ncbi:J domain-containing protein [Bacteroidales bacterium OttesenSCG-928-B11]|nr:J domain-containing protein [Bacteroidales bacterium OttesenSCG-928-B11]
MENAYSILGIGQDATQSDIIKGQVNAMREKRFSPREIALAKEQLSSPIQRLAVDFTYLQLPNMQVSPLKTKIKSISIELNDIDPNLFNSL